MTEVAVEALRFARIPMPRGYAYRGDGPARYVAALRAGDDALDAPCLAFVVRHPERGPILVDTGLHPDAHRSLGDFGVPLRLFFRSLEPVGPPFDEELGRRGVRPADVELVVMTHLHVDHTGGMRLLPRASFVTTPQEWAAAHARGAALNGYRRAHLPGPERMRFVDVSRGEPHGPFAATHDLLGDGSIRLLWTPGHTHGHVAVLLRTGGGPVLLAGDAAYTTANIADDHLPLITADDADSHRSLAALREFAADNPAAPVVPSHDPAAWRRLDAGDPAA